MFHGQAYYIVDLNFTVDERSIIYGFHFQSQYNHGNKFHIKITGYSPKTDELPNLNNDVGLEISDKNILLLRSCLNYDSAIGVLNVCSRLFSVKTRLAHKIFPSTHV